MNRILHVVLTLTSLAWLVAMFAFVSMPDDAPIWRGSPVGLTILALLLAVGFILYEAWHLPTRPARRADSMADQAPGIRARREQRPTPCYRHQQHSLTDW
jgi:hypothetical protein